MIFLNIIHKFEFLLDGGRRKSVKNLESRNSANKERLPVKKRFEGGENPAHQKTY